MSVFEHIGRAMGFGRPHNAAEADAVLTDDKDSASSGGGLAAVYAAFRKPTSSGSAPAAPVIDEAAIRARYADDIKAEELAAREEGRREAAARCQSITESAQAKGRRNYAIFLATETDMTAEAALAALAMAPMEEPPKVIPPLLAAGGAPNPRVDAYDGGPGTPMGEFAQGTALVRRLNAGQPAAGQQS